MIVESRKGSWVARVYTKDSENAFKVVAEQYYPTRKEMREGIKLWKALTYSSNTKVKIKTYRIQGLIEGFCQYLGPYNTVMYKEVR